MIEHIIAADRDRVWSVLMEASNYPRWVVGAKRFRSADASWPQPGSRFQHAVGLGPLELHDDTQLLERDDRTRVKLEARARPAGRAHVELHLEDGDGATTRVRMSEEAVTGLASYLPERLLRPFIDARNRESLRRLARIVDGGSADRER